ncbi:hypothetical protein Tco_0266874 [Tanacetum coccineum]
MNQCTESYFGSSLHLSSLILLLVSRLTSTGSGLRRGETVKADHVLRGFWPSIKDGDFVVGGMTVKKVREDDEVEEAADEGAGGSADVYPNMSRGDWVICACANNFSWVSLETAVSDFSDGLGWSLVASSP